MQLVKALVSAREELASWRQHLHQNPEIAYEEKTHPTLLQPSLKTLALRFIAGLAAPVWLG